MSLLCIIGFDWWIGLLLHSDLSIKSIDDCKNIEYLSMKYYGILNYIKKTICRIEFKFCIEISFQGPAEATGGAGSRNCGRTVRPTSTAACWRHGANPGLCSKEVLGGSDLLEEGGRD